MSNQLPGRQGVWLTEGQMILLIGALLNPIFAFVMGSSYLFFGNDLFAPQTPTEYGKSIILVGIIGTFSTLLGLVLLTVALIASFNIISASLPPTLQLPFQR